MKIPWIAFMIMFAGVPAGRAPAEDSRVSGCTVLTISQDGEVFFGGNDDFDSRDKTYWIDPGTEGTYGAIYFGDPDNIQQGFNEAGLAFDANGLTPATVTAHNGTIPGPVGYTQYPIAILKACATVAEVLEWVETHQWLPAMRDQMHFADASGDAAIISVGADGRLAYTRKPQGDSYLVSTNFNVANPANGDYPSWRYDTATDRAAELLNSRVISRDRVASIMEAVHVETQRNYTVYTVVADLKRGQVALYFMFQYDDPILLDIPTELAKGAVLTSLRAMVPEATVARADEALERLDRVSRSTAIAGYAWAAMVIGCAVLWVCRPTARTNGGRSLFATAILGPVGFLVSALSTGIHRVESYTPFEALPRRHGWMEALYSAHMDAASIVPPLVIGILLLLYVPSIGSSATSPIVFVIIVPVLFAWIAVRAPSLSARTRIGYLRSIAGSAAPALFASGVLIAATLPFLFPLALWLDVRSQSLLVFALVLWALVALVCSVGSLLLAVFYRIAKYPIGKSRFRRFVISVLMIVSGLVLSMYGIYFASQTAQMFVPLIEGAQHLP